MSGRSDGFTDEQARAWCRCDTADGPNEECPLHGRFGVEWQCFDDYDGEPIGVEYLSEEMRDDLPGGPLAAALESAENEQRDIQRDGSKVHLRYRLVLPWTDARA